MVELQLVTCIFGTASMNFLLDFKGRLDFLHKIVRLLLVRNNSPVYLYIVVCRKIEPSSLLLELEAGFLAGRYTIGTSRTDPESWA